MRFEIRTLIRDRRGSVAAIFALAFVPLLLAAGAAVDASRAYLVRARLTAALDAAGLAVGSSTGTETELQAVAERFFRKNYPDAALGDFVSLSTTIDSKVVRLTAERKLDTMFMHLIGYDSIPVRSSVEITREVKGLEVALALDNTGSMSQNGKIQALRASATDLVNILFGDNPAPEKLKIALVPFVTNVNIGNDDPALTAAAIDPASLSSANFKGTTWQGCVVERPYPHNIQDTSIAAGGRWRAYSWPMEPRYRKNSTQSSQCNNRANASGTGWNSISEPSAAGQNSMASGSGPNKGCPLPAILKLTNNKAALLADIQRMRPWDATGTMTHVGLAWALRAISPNDPFRLGLPYGTEGWNKAIVLMTDGVNDLVKQNSTCYSNSDGPYTAFTGEGYPVDDHTLGTSGSTKAAEYENVLDRLDQLTAEACSFVKSKGVILYTILLQVNNAATQNLYRNCASSPDKFFNVPSASELGAAFRAIAEDLSNLRVSK
jgi:Flp pilus assembly protein TadG